MSFLRRVAGRSLSDRVRSSITWEELGVEPAPPHREEPAEAARASVSDPPWTPSSGGVPDMPCRRRPRGRPRTRWSDYVTRLAWEGLEILPGRGCLCSDSCPHDPAPYKQKKMDGWMDGWIDSPLPVV